MQACVHCGRDLYRGFGPICPHCGKDPKVKHDPSEKDACGCRRSKPGLSNAQKAIKAEERRAQEKDRMDEEGEESE